MRVLTSAMVTSCILGVLFLAPQNAGAEPEAGPGAVPGCGDSFRAQYTGYQQEGDNKFGVPVTYVDVKRWVGGGGGMMDFHFKGGSSDRWNVYPRGGTAYPTAPTGAAAKPWRAWVYNGGGALACTADFVVKIRISTREQPAHGPEQAARVAVDLTPSGLAGATHR